MIAVLKKNSGQIALGTMSVIFGLLSGCYAFTYAQGVMLDQRIDNNRNGITEVQGDIKEINAKLDVLLRDRGYDPRKI